jgi:hypothetical protein
VNELDMKAVLAGLLFGLWPIFMSKSNLNGNTASAVFCVACFVGVLPFALHAGGFSFATANWTMVLLAGVAGAGGLLLFNGMLAKAQPVDIPMLFVAMLLAQIVVPATYQMILQGISFQKLAGFAAAGLAVYLLK